MYLNIEYFFNKVYTFLAGIREFFVEHEAGLWNIFNWSKIISLIFVGLFFAGTIYSFLRLFKLRKKQLSEFAKIIVEEPPKERASRWDRIKKYIESENSSDWRRAVIEADTLLDDILRAIGYKGTTLGERLKKVKPAQFKNLSEIWQAHKVRNRIVHEGERYELTKDEAERVLELYKKAFEELEYI